MKKIYYLFAFVVAAAAFSACKPLSKTYDTLGDLPKPVAPAVTANLTLAAADYGLLPSANYAKTSLSFKNKTDASASIPAILTSKYPSYGDKSSITVTYGVTNPSIKLADSLYADIYYTPTTADYYSVTVKYTDFSTAQAISFLNLKYPTPAANQLSVLNYTYYESGVTTSAGVANTIHSYLYLNGAWTKIYTISAAQYVTAGRGVYNEFLAADAPNLPTIFNSLLKADPQVSAAPKVGDVIYISYNYYSSKDYQRVQPLTYDGTNWVATPTPATLQFIKTNGVWAADNSVYYSLTTADYASINTLASISGIGSSGARANVAQYGDFNISSTASSTTWVDSDVTLVIIQLLLNDFKSTAVANQKFVVTYLAYSGSTFSVTKSFTYDGTTFVYNP